MSVLGMLDSITQGMNTGLQIAEGANNRAFLAEQAEIQRGFNHDEAQLAYERALQADSTKHQREVQDLIRAGLNPILATGMSGGSVQSSPASASVPAGAQAHIGKIDALAAYRFEMERRMVDAQVANIDADTAKKQSETEGLTLDNEIKAASKDAVIESRELENQLTREKLSEVRQGIKESESRIGKLIAETETEVDKRALISAQKILADAESRQIIEMLPYSKQLTLAKTEGERNAALLAAAHTAYQNHLIDDGYIDAFIKNAQASASSAEATAELNQIKAAIRTGDYSKSGKIFYGKTAEGIMQGLTILLDNINPLNSIFK